MAKGKPGDSITLVGAGNLASALAEILPRSGCQVNEIVTRSLSPQARRLGQKAGAQVTTLERAQWSGRIVWLAVSDRSIRGVSEAVAPTTNWRGKIVLHSSGALSSGVLVALRRRGAHVASAHPMMTFVPGESPDLRTVVWAVEGDAVAVAAARRIIKALRGRAITVASTQKPLYHAFGAFLSPLLVVHLATATEIAAKIGIARRDVNPLMKPILEKTLSNFLANIDQAGGAGKAFSGPLIRGDVETIRTHLGALGRIPNARKLYVALLESALKSDLPVKNRTAIGKLINRSR